VEISAVFTTLTPTEWQAPPEWMNFHYLVRAEQCPRSAALRHATYAQLWNRRGYPDKPSLAALAGMVMHRAIARIIRALADSGVDSFQNPRSVAILKSLGGYSKVIAESVADVTKSLAGNPRFELVRSSSVARLNNRIPAIREQVQLQLSRLKWKLQPASVDLADDLDSDAVASGRVPLEQNTWSAECQLSNHIPIGSTVLLRWTPKDGAALDHLLPGSEVRLSGALISYSEDARLQIVSCSTTTDLILPSQ
jgi:hypothetical protein